MTRSPVGISGVVLAGGRSARMGFDKARLRIEGQSLLEHQIELLRGAGVDEVLVSLPAGSNPQPPVTGTRVIVDALPVAGPLGGIERALDTARNDLVLVVAVDMPALTAAFLASLMAQCRSGRGVVPTAGASLEPLVAIYPKAARPLALQELGSGRGAAQTFARACLQAKLVIQRELTPAERSLVENWNTPEDLPLAVRAAAAIAPIPVDGRTAPNR